MVDLLQICCFILIIVAISRWTEPDCDRPYRVPFYPLPPLLVIVIAFVILISSLMVAPLFIILALLFTSLSFPVHILIEKYQNHVATNRFVHEQLSVVDHMDEESDHGHI